MQMPNSTQSKLRLLVLLQKKYFYTRKNIVTKPNLDEFLGKVYSGAPWVIKFGKLSIPENLVIT